MTAKTASKITDQAFQESTPPTFGQNQTNQNPPSTTTFRHIIPFSFEYEGDFNKFLDSLTCHKFENETTENNSSSDDSVDNPSALKNENNGSTDNPSDDNSADNSPKNDSVANSSTLNYTDFSLNIENNKITGIKYEIEYNKQKYFFYPSDFHIRFYENKIGFIYYSLSPDINIFRSQDYDVLEFYNYKVRQLKEALKNLLKEKITNISIPNLGIKFLLCQEKDTNVPNRAVTFILHDASKLNLCQEDQKDILFKLVHGNLISTKDCSDKDFKTTSRGFNIYASSIGFAAIGNDKLGSNQKSHEDNLNFYISEFFDNYLYALSRYYAANQFNTNLQKFFRDNRTKLTSEDEATDINEKISNLLIDAAIMNTYGVRIFISKYYAVEEAYTYFLNQLQVEENEKYTLDNLKILDTICERKAQAIETKEKEAAEKKEKAKAEKLTTLGLLFAACSAICAIDVIANICEKCIKINKAYSYPILIVIISLTFFYLYKKYIKSNDKKSNL